MRRVVAGVVGNISFSVLKENHQYEAVVVNGKEQKTQLFDNDAIALKWVNRQITRMVGQDEFDRDID